MPAYEGVLLSHHYLNRRISSWDVPRPATPSRATKALVAELRAQGVACSPRRLEDWRRVGFVPRGHRRFFGRGRGTEVVYPDDMAERSVDQLLSTVAGRRLEGLVAAQVKRSGVAPGEPPSAVARGVLTNLFLVQLGGEVAGGEELIELLTGMGVPIDEFSPREQVAAARFMDAVLSAFSFDELAGVAEHVPLDELRSRSGPSWWSWRPRRFARSSPRRFARSSPRRSPSCSLRWSSSSVASRPASTPIRTASVS